MVSDYRSYQREAERRRFGREAEHGHWRIYGHGEGRGVVLEEHADGERVAQHLFSSPDAAKEFLAQIVDEHFGEGEKKEDGEPE